MSDDNLLSALVYRIDFNLNSPVVTMLAKYDHMSNFESHAGAITERSLYGGCGKDYVDAISILVANNPPSPGNDSTYGNIGGFKVVKSDYHQLIYAADSDGLCIAIITGLRYPSRVATQMIIELYNRYTAEIGIQSKSATASSLTKTSKPILANTCKKYSNFRSVDKTSSLILKVDEVKVEMQENIASVLRNIDKADGIVDQASQLNEQANVFKKRSSTLRKQMKCRNIKMTIILLTVVGFILALILIPVIIRSKSD